VIVVDASALVAMMQREPEGEQLAAVLETFGRSGRYASTVSVWEAACAVARLRGCDRSLGFARVSEMLELATIQPVAPDMTITALAAEAAQRYGIGPGYPSILNLGDCFSYATARHLGAALLFKGNDFSRTDIAAA